MKQVVLYTDGACRGNPGPGGWGVVIFYGKHERRLYGGDPDTTNNRMELTAVIEGLRALREPCAAHIHTDSRYVLQGMTEWLPNWKRRGWKTAGRKDVKNRDLWMALDEEVARHEVDWTWVKGHAGDPHNELADELANQGIDDLQLDDAAP